MITGKPNSINTGNNNPSPPLSIQEYANHVEQLKLFLAMAPTTWSDPNEKIKRFMLPNKDAVSCILWNNLFFITGTDIVKCLVFRFEAIGRPVTNMKKFEEGIFSDLRNLKPGQDAALEEPRSKFLDFLFTNSCIRTQKKQKVFYWYSVPHDRIFLDALERDLKREAMGLETATTRSGIFKPENIANTSYTSNNINSIPEQKNGQQLINRGNFFQLSPTRPLANISRVDLAVESPGLEDHQIPSLHASSKSLNLQPLLPPAMGGSVSPDSEQPHQLLLPNSSVHSISQASLIPIAPKSSPAPSTPQQAVTPVITGGSLVSPPFSNITLDGSPNYKKQRRKNLVFRGHHGSTPVFHPYNQSAPSLMKSSVNLNNTPTTPVQQANETETTDLLEQMLSTVDSPSLLDIGSLSPLEDMIMNFQQEESISNQPHAEDQPLEEEPVEDDFDKFKAFVVELKDGDVVDLGDFDLEGFGLESFLDTRNCV